MARLTAFSAFADELSFPQIARIETAFTFSDPFVLNRTSYPSQFEMAFDATDNARFILAIGSTTGLTGDNVNQTASGTGQGVYLFRSDGSGGRTLLWAVERASFDAAQLINAVKALSDPFGGSLILEDLLAGNDTVKLPNAQSSARGYAGNDTLIGGSQQDALYGDQGRDSLSGGAGNDALDGGDGQDTLVGGTGDDTFIFTAKDKVVEKSGGGLDTMIGNLSFTLASHVEYGRLNDGTKALSLTGNGSANSLSGNGRANTLNGMDGNDALFGNGGRDTLKGGSGRDTLIGDAGADALYGGSGRDVFTFAGLDGTGSNRDTIHDFARGDIINLSFLGVTELSASAEANSAWLSRKSGGTVISVDITGDTIADVEIFVKGSYRLSSGDFDFA